ncbi:Protein F56D1.2, partial [Aphelenchoides avenae]
NTYVVTIPSYPQVEPSMREWTSIYPGWKSRDLSWWSPLVFVDMNDDEGILFHYEPPKVFRVKELIVSIYSQADGVSSFLHKERITAPETSVRWTNVEAGSYYAVVYLDRHDCSIDCKDGPHCVVCPFTMVNFTVPVDKYTPERQRYLAVLGVAKTLAWIAFVILIILVISLAASVIYLRHIRPRQLARRPPQSVELTARPTVLVLYADDCAEHSKAVKALVHLLEQHAIAKVLIDQTAFNDPATRPSIWLMNAITSAQFVLVVFSEATQRIMNGEKLIQRRPFPDQFNTAVRLVVSKINEALSSEAVPVPTPGNNSTSSPLLRTSQRPPDVGMSSSRGLKRYLVARFAYSSPLVVPEFFRLLKCSHLVIPDDMGKLIGRLHGIDTENTSSVELGADLSELQAAISAYKEMLTNKPHFLNERFVSQEEADQPDQIVVLPETIPLRPPDKVPDAAEIRQMAEKYGLPVRPDDVDSDEEQVNGVEVATKAGASKYQLVGTLDDVSISDSD